MKNLIIPLLVIILISSSCHKKNIQKKCGDGKIVYYTIDSAVLFIPNIFTPNGDGMNDFFMMRGRNIASLSLKISGRQQYIFQFDKNKVIYQTTDVNFKWKGIQTEGNYPFVVDAVTTSGKSIHAESDVAIIIDPSKYCLKQMHNCAFDEQFQNGSYNASYANGELLFKCQ